MYGFQSVAVYFIAEFSFRFCCFVFDINQLKVKFADYYAITKKGLRINSLITVNAAHYFSNTIIMCIFSSPEPKAHG